MMRGLYTAATGMNGMQSQIDVTSNNIANVNTTGFKKDRAEFEDLIYESMNYTAGRTSQTTLNPTGIDVGLGVRLVGVQKNFTVGNLQNTNNPLDLAIEGKGFFKITMPDGQTAYTKTGTFKPNEEGTLVNSSGYALEPQIVIPQNVTKISIGKDGTVSGEDSNSTSVALGQITLANFINPAGLTPLGGNLYLGSEASGPVQEGTPDNEQFGAVQQGWLEMSNVKLVNEMVDLITAQRAYEANSKVIKTSDSMLQTVNQLKN